MTHNFFRNASALLLVYDICNAQSFVNVANWIADVKRYASPNVTLVMIGNKSDCSSQRMVIVMSCTLHCDVIMISFLNVSVYYCKLYDV